MAGHVRLTAWTLATRCASACVLCVRITQKHLEEVRASFYKSLIGAEAVSHPRRGLWRQGEEQAHSLHRCS